MLDSITLLRAVGEIREESVLDTIRVLHLLDNQPHQQHKYRKVLRVIMIAAIIAALMGATAYAIGKSIQRQRQEELRNTLQIDENYVTDYVEYPLVEEPENTPTEGVTILSTINDGEFQRLWVVINGVTTEMIERLTSSEQVDWAGQTLPLNGHRYCRIHATLDGESYFEAMTTHVLDGYDSESQTLMTECDIPLLDLEEGRKVILSFVMLDHIDYELDHSEAEIVCQFGSVEVERTGQAIRVVWFPEPVPFENGSYGKGEFLGAEITASGINWILRHDGVSQMYRSHEFSDEAEKRTYREMEQSWLAVIEGLERGAVIRFADGSSREVGLPLSSSLSEGDIVKDHCPCGRGTINLYQVVSITIGGKTFSFE